jgi:hypothetical protein
MATYNETRVNLTAAILESDGKTIKKDDKTGEPVVISVDNKTEKQANELIASYKTAGLPEPEATKIQTFQYTTCDSPDQLVSLLKVYNPDGDIAEKLAVDIINRGLVLAQQKSVREFMLDPDQAVVEGVYDLMQDVKPGEGRRKADPASKAIKAMSELLGRPITQEELNSFLQSFAAQAQQPVGA